MQNKIRHHYVPQYYLNGFTESNSSLIWVYEKGKNTTFKTKSKEIALERNFYTFIADDGSNDSNSFENYLADSIEKPANPIIGKIRDSEFITSNEKVVLSTYLSVLIKRVPRNFERMKSMVPNAAESVWKEIDKAITGAINDNPDNAKLLEERRIAARHYLEQYASNLPKKFFLQYINTSLADVIYSMKWRFFTNNTNSPFLSSDNPCFYFEWLGINQKQSEITFPISKDIALWATWNENIVEGFCPATDSIVREINRRTANNATRYMFASIDAEWIVNLVNKKRYRLNRMV